MKGENKGFATRTKVTLPMSIYIHCYGHLINLALQDTLENVPVVRNTLRIIQFLYNFLDASPRGMLYLKVLERMKERASLCRRLKSQSVTDGLAIGKL